MNVEEMLQRMVPNPTPEDAHDMVTIAFSYGRVMDRRCDRLQAKLNEAKARIASLIDASAPEAEEEPEDPEVEPPRPPRATRRPLSDDEK